MDIVEAVGKIKDQCDNYRRTVRALQATAYHLLLDDSTGKPSALGRAYFGASLDTSADNRVSPNKRVTPDLIVMAASSLNVLVEAKLALSANQGYRRTKLVEIQKYDDDLGGFEIDGHRFADHDIILLVSYTHANNVREDILHLEKANLIRFDRSFAVVRFLISTERKTWFVLELSHGSLSNTKKSQSFAAPCRIDMDCLISDPLFGHIEFYDADPPLPLLMDLMQERIANGLTKEQARELREKGQVDIPMKVDRMRKQLAEMCGPTGNCVARTPEIPKTQWIRSALDGFGQLGWATKVNAQAYTFHLKKRRNPFEQFCKLWARDYCKSSEQKEKRRQREIQKLPLFKDLIERETGSI
jgi:hypothetical protein